MLLTALMSLALAFSWATAFPWIKIALEDGSGPLTIVAIRLSIGAAIVWLWRLVLTRKAGFSRAHLKPFLVMAVVGNILPFSLITFGQQDVPSNMTSLLVATVPLFTLLMAHFALKDEQMTLLKAAGVVLAVAGVGVLVLPGFESAGGVAGNMLPVAMILGGTACYAFMNVYGRKNSLDIDPWTLAAGMLMVSALLAVPLAFVFERPLQMAVTPAGWQALLGLGLIPTALATILYFPTLKRGGALAGAVAGNLIPVFAVLLSAWLVNEPVTRALALGAALILFGMVLIQPRGTKTEKKAKEGSGFRDVACEEEDLAGQRT